MLGLEQSILKGLDEFRAVVGTATLSTLRLSNSFFTSQKTKRREMPHCDSGRTSSVTTADMREVYAAVVSTE